MKQKAQDIGKKLELQKAKEEQLLQQCQYVNPQQLSGLGNIGSGSEHFSFGDIGNQESQKQLENQFMQQNKNSNWPNFNFGNNNRNNDRSNNNNNYNNNNNNNNNNNENNITDDGNSGNNEVSDNDIDIDHRGRLGLGNSIESENKNNSANNSANQGNDNSNNGKVLLSTIGFRFWMQIHEKKKDRKRAVGTMAGPNGLKVIGEEIAAIHAEFPSAGNKVLATCLGLSASSVANMRGALHYIDFKNYKYGNETQIKSSQSIANFARKENFKSQSELYKKAGKNYWPDAEKIGLNLERITKLRTALTDGTWDHGLQNK